ncbi:MAG: PDZ domain-containing protein [Deltaproteobacteria bacterium]|nr:PDZ domain-containing protein [Deltaproteobacteria bacterium]
MSTKRSVLFVASGIVVGALLTALLFWSLQERDNTPAPAAPQQPETTPPPAKDTAADVAQSRNFEVPDWEILSPGRDLRGDCNICGQIFSEAGTPLSDAVVRLRLLDEPWRTANLPDVVTTADDGRYCFKGLTAKALYQLYAWKQDFATASFDDVVCNAATDLYLQKGARLTLRFLDVQGYSVPYVEVHIGGSAIWPLRRALSDDRGRISIAGLAEGVYSFSAQKDDLSYSVSDPISLGPGEEVELEAQMAHIPAIGVTVLSGPDNTPVKDAVVTAVLQNESLLAHTYITDSNGKAVISGLSESGITLTVAATGFTTKKVERILPGAAVNVTMSRGAIIKGVVQTPGGKPIAGAVINARLQQGELFDTLPSRDDRLFIWKKALAEQSGLPQAIDVNDSAACIIGPARIPLPQMTNEPAPPPDSGNPLSWQTTNAAGEFFLDAIPTGRISLGATHELFVQFRRPTLNAVVGQAFEDVPILMRKGATLSLRVVTRENQPISEATVTAYDMEGQILKSAQSESNGYVELAGLPEEFRVEAVARQYIPGVRKIFGPPGETVDTFIRLDDANLVLRGRVVNSYGTGVAGVAVEAELAQKGAIQVLTGESDSDGSFALEGASDATYTVRARIDGEVRATAETATANSSINMVVNDDNPTEESGVTAISPVSSPPLRHRASTTAPSPIPTPSVEKFGSGDSLGVITSGLGQISFPKPPASSSSDFPGTTAEAPNDGEYVAGSSQGAFGNVDDLVVTGPPTGIGTVPVVLKMKNKHVVVANVQQGSLVAAAGLKSGAILLTIDGREITSVAMARRALQGTIGSVVMIEVTQDDEPLSVVVQRERK